MTNEGDPSYQDQVHDLLRRARHLDTGDERVDLTEEAVRLADVHGDLSLGFEARDELISAATFSGYPERALVAFSWCLAQCDREPERFHERRMLWKYKWVAAHLPYFPQITKARIHEVHEDMTRRYERCGQSLQPVFKIRWQAARRMGDAESARAFYRESELLERDWGSDCRACDLNDRIRYLLFTEQLEAAIEAASPILEGRLGCAEIPHATLAMLLQPLIRLGRHAEATGYHRRGYRMVRGNREFVDSIADHLEFLVLTDNLAPALQVFEEHVRLVLDVQDLDDRFQFFRASLLLFTRLAAEERKERKLRLPPAFPPHRADDTYHVPDLRAWFEEATGALADRFDARNQNDAFRQDLAAALRDLTELGGPYPLSGGH